MIIAIDYDGTIADMNREKARWIKANLGHVVSPWKCSRTECVPIIGVEAYERMGDSVYERERTLQTNEVPGTLDALRALSKKTTIYIVTARSERRIPFAREWLESNEVLSCFEEIHTSDGVKGKEALIDYFKKLLSRNPDWVWTQIEPIPMEGGFLNKWLAKIPVGDKVIECIGICFVQFNSGGKIRRNEVYFDRSELISEICRYNRSKQENRTAPHTATQSMKS